MIRNFDVSMLCSTGTRRPNQRLLLRDETKCLLGSDLPWASNIISYFEYFGGVDWRSLVKLG